MRCLVLRALAGSQVCPQQFLIFAHMVFRRWEDNIKMDLQEVRCGDMDWIELAEDRDRWHALMNAAMNLGVPNCGEFLD